MKFKNTDTGNLLVLESVELVSWDEKYATGIAKIDNQHRELVKLTNRLYNACHSSGEEADAVFKEAMSKMVEYVRFHFSAELQILERINYPEYHDHKKQHEDLVKNILEAVKEFGENKPLVPHHFVRTLKDWVFSHIAIYDKSYALYISVQMKNGLLSEQQISG
jgi:hemerythrin-like metal-binding protein